MIAFLKKHAVETRNCMLSFKLSGRAQYRVNAQTGIPNFITTIRKLLNGDYLRQNALTGYSIKAA